MYLPMSPTSAFSDTVLVIQLRFSLYIVICVLDSLYLQVQTNIIKFHWILVMIGLIDSLAVI